MRIFIAIKSSPSLQKKASTWKSGYKKLPVRWLKPKNLHITLVPPFYQDEINDLKKILKKTTTKIKPFTVEFQKVTYGPDPKRPRLIWAEGKLSAELSILKKILEKSLFKEKFIKKIEKRTFLPHVTIARFKPNEFKKFLIKKIDDKISCKEKIDSIVIMQSHISPLGAEYKVLEEIPFS